MKRCLTLAKKGAGKTSPNPLVGCVVLDKYGKVISEGFHKKYGEFHAERDALSKLPYGKAEGGTLYVNLEPCSHWGKTPPCTDIIIEHKLKQVVIGMRDVNPKVDGISRLKGAGIEVVEGILEDECKNLNEIFIKNQTEKKIFVALKTATTLDGKISAKSGDSKWITGEKARNYGKNLRKKYDAILTSSSTVIADNPSMKHHTKVVLDRQLKTDFKNSKIYKNGKIIVFYGNISEIPPKIKDILFIKTPEKNEKLDLDFIFNKLFELEIMSVFVEAGGKLSGEILPFADKIYQFVAPKITGDNEARSCFDFQKINKISQSINFKFIQYKKIGDDILLEYKKV